MNEQQSDKTKIEESVMTKIKSGQVKLRSKYIFLAEKLGLRSTFVLTVMLAVLFFNLILFYLKSSDNLIYLSFGSRGWLAFLESFPYLLVIGLIIVIFISTIILKKSDWSYKKPFGFFVLSLLIFVILAGGALALTNINQRFRERGPNWSRSLLPPTDQERGFGLAGRIIEVNDDYALVQTPHGLKKVIVKEASSFNQEELNEGVFAVFIGQREKDYFLASHYRIVNEQEMEMIRQDVRSRFGQFNPPQLPQRNEKVKGCLDDCFGRGNQPEECWQTCDNNH